MDIAVIILGILCATIIVTAIIQSSRLSMWRTRAHEAVERAERAENALKGLIVPFTEENFPKVLILIHEYAKI